MAREAGLSPAAVSRHLNGTLELPEPTRKRIEAAVRRLAYRPNPHARRLSLGRSDTITLIVPDIANPFFATLAATVERAAFERGMIVQLHATSNVEARELAVLQLAADHRSDGVVFCTNRKPGPDVAEAIAALPRAVIVDEGVPGARAPQVFADNAQGGYLAGRHLARWQHRKIAYLGGDPALMSTRLRAEGLERGLREESGGAEVGVRILSGRHDVASGRALAAELLDAGGEETAIFVGSDELAIGVIETLRARGVRIPQDMSLVSFDGARALHLYDPPITAVRQPARQLGERAVELLLDGDWDDPALPDRVEYLPVELIERASVAAPNLARRARADHANQTDRGD
ncbi:LacI family DNA-binding transcriptional regulator [Jannaschia ovalis]|uniref:LacI family DNA-binding transcriptional regulator n=1 Tax=Jannaschia ovalis TaxID=3038773 RepID=A0ABY8LE49_9RHOB|nr:LacI family DNA-binding transcriptional regulator [Jannaschia sp. GRR-S6-38]WGH79601.1 LacI family DNA-binding transcriptional regulator [Jannaschia sp. GRR-S6-38]